jgi:hypothetical protein
MRIFDRDERLKVLSVKGPPFIPGRFVAGVNGTVVIDEETGLMFQAGEQQPMTWVQALEYCKKLELGGYSDWRLPNIRELMTIVSFDREGPPYLDSRFFPWARAGTYWSSTTVEEAPYMAWTLDFSNGLPYRAGFKARRYFVRAVRAGRRIKTP